jgi:hypothetical protein
MKRYIPLAVAAALLIAGCGKKEEDRLAAPKPPESKPADVKQSTVPAPPLPAPNVPKGAAPELPKPGQANDHSSPAFKGGGVPDKNK